MNKMDAFLVANKRNYFDRLFDVKMSDENFVKALYSLKKENLSAIVKGADYFPIIGEEGDCRRIESGSLYISYHYSMYLLLPLLFYKRSIPLTVFAANQDAFPPLEGIEYYDSNDPFVYLKMRNDLQAGKAVLIYADAYTGNSKTYMQSSFLRKTLRIESSLMKFAQRVKNKYFIISEGVLSWNLVANIYSFPKDNDIKAWSDKYVSILEQHVRKHPKLWLQWSIIEQMIPNENDVSPMKKRTLMWKLIIGHYKKRIFNRKRYVVYEEEKISYLLDMLTYHTFQISDTIRKYLSNGRHSIEDMMSILPREDVRFLISNSVMI